MSAYEWTCSDTCMWAVSLIQVNKGREVQQSPPDTAARNWLISMQSHASKQVYFSWVLVLWFLGRRQYLTFPILFSMSFHSDYINELRFAKQHLFNMAGLFSEHVKMLNFDSIF